MWGVTVGLVARKVAFGDGIVNLNVLGEAKLGWECRHTLQEVDFPLTYYVV